jgi:hypothetical protein
VILYLQTPKCPSTRLVPILVSVCWAAVLRPFNSGVAWDLFIQALCPARIDCQLEESHSEPVSTNGICLYRHCAQPAFIVSCWIHTVILYLHTP